MNELKEKIDKLVEQTERQTLASSEDTDMGFNAFLEGKLKGVKICQKYVNEDAKDSLPDKLIFDLFGIVEQGDMLPDRFNVDKLNELVYDTLKYLSFWYKRYEIDISEWIEYQHMFEEKWVNRYSKEDIAICIEQKIQETRDELYKIFNIDRFEKLGKF